MNKIINLVFTVILISLILIVYLNIDKISDFVTQVLMDEKKVSLKEKNDYTRNFEYIKFQNSDEFKPVDEESILNTFYKHKYKKWSKSFILSLFLILHFTFVVFKVENTKILGIIYSLIFNL